MYNLKKKKKKDKTDFRPAIFFSSFICCHEFLSTLKLCFLPLLLRSSILGVNCHAILSSFQTLFSAFIASFYRSNNRSKIKKTPQKCGKMRSCLLNRPRKAKFLFCRKYSAPSGHRQSLGPVLLMFLRIAALIRKTCPCNEHPLTPHFYIVKLGFTRVYIFFLFLL